MESADIVPLSFAFLILLVLSAFFSGSETAFFSLSKVTLRQLREQNDPAARRVIRLLDRPRRLLVTFLIGNTLVNVAFASLSAISIDTWFQSMALPEALAIAINVVVVTFILIVLVEISPKVFALKNNERWALNLSLIILTFYYLLYPVTRIFVAFVKGFSKILGVESSKVLFNEEEIRTLAEIAEEHGVLEEDEKEMITSIFEFGETEVNEVMIPRIDMEALPMTATLKEAADLVQSCGHSRIPVYENDLDHIKGILYAKDLIGRSDEDSSRILPELIKEAYFIPETKKISELLKEFQTEKIHMAVIVDEYGGTEGLVTLEDILEEIVGEIQDEYDQEENLVVQLDNGETKVLAKLEVEEFNNLMKENVIPTEEDYETIGGFIFALAGEVPKPGNEYSHQGWSFTITGIDGNRIVSLRVKPPEDVQNPFENSLK